MEEFDDRILKQRRQLQDLARSYRQSQILLTCIELGVFDVLSGCSSSAAEVAMAIGADGRAVELLLNAAVALGILEKRDLRYSNNALTETYLTQSCTIIDPAR